MKNIQLVKVIPYTEEIYQPSIKMNKQLFHFHFNTQTCFLKCGHQIVKATVELEDNKHTEAFIKVSKSISQKLQLPTISFSSQLMIDEDQVLHVYPIFAILTEIVETEHNPSFPTIQSFCKEIADYCVLQGILFYVFSLQHIKNQAIEGYMYVEDKWVKTIVPFPDVVYNRLHSRKQEQSEAFAQLCQYLQSYKIPYFNDHYLNKWESYTILNEQVHLQPYLPETELFTTKQNLEDFLHHHEHIFLKPIHGSQGKRIIRVANKDNNFLLDYTTFSGEIEKSFPTIAMLYQALRTRLSKEPFIIQQGIFFIQYQQKNVDFRVLCHRDQSGLWKTTSIIGRVSGEDGFVSNIARGGKLIKAQDVLAQSFDMQTITQILKSMKELAVEIASIISNESAGYYGEFGIDLGVDQNGHPWIIEVNTKPSKNDDTLQEPQKVRPSTKAIIKYVLYLANLE